MNWEDILKYMQLIPKEEEVEIELDNEALGESCCGQAKLDYITSMVEMFQEKLDKAIEDTNKLINAATAGPKKDKANKMFAEVKENQKEIQGMIVELEQTIEGAPCNEFRIFLRNMASLPNHPETKIAKEILKDWKECEGNVE